MSWRKQSGEALFPEVLWNRPVNRHRAGRLLIVGGHSQQFSATQAAYAKARESGAGFVRIALPDSLRKITGALPDCQFLPSTPSGSLALEALEQLRGFSRENDAVLLPGELSTNAETTSLIVRFLASSEAPVVITDEVIKTLLPTPEALQPAAVCVASISIYSQLAKALKIPLFVKQPDLRKEIALLEAIGEQLNATLVCHAEGHVIVHQQGRTSVTPVDSHEDSGSMAAIASTLLMQHPDPFAAVTTAAYILAEKG